MPDIDDVKPGETVEIGAALRVEQPAALAAYHDPEAVAFGEVEPSGAMDPHMVERLSLDRREFACRRRVVHGGEPCCSRMRSSSMPQESGKDTDMPSFEHHGARIYYEEFGQGFPILTFAPAGLASVIAVWSEP